MNKSPANLIEQQVQRAFPLKKWSSVRTLVAVSGGPDSVALIRAMAEIATRDGGPSANGLHVGHVNHGLRKSESNFDQQFVQRLAADLKLPFHGLAVVPAASHLSESQPPSEESLRKIRHEKLVDLANQIGARYVVMGHNHDDQVETILFRILRGTGISGLSGIRPYRLIDDSVTLVRPLLEINRAEILAYLKSIGQDFRVDQSNLESVYARNYLRNELIPELKNRFGDSVPQAIARLGAQAEQVDQYLSNAATSLGDAVVDQTETQVQINCTRLQGVSPLLVRQFISQVWSQQNWPRQAMSYQWWQRIGEAIQDDSDTVYNLPCLIRFEKNGSNASFSSAPPL